MRTSVAVVVLVALVAPAAAADPTEVVHGELGAKLDAAVREFPGIDFAGTVLCAKDGVVHLARGYGLADRAKKRPNTTETLFDIGSVAKQHTAAAILWLADRGRLDIADPLAKHLDAVPEDKRPITLHQMLTHTSGLARGMAAGKIRPEYHTDREAFVRAVMAEPLESKPGTAFAYNNMAYMVLAAVVERVSGEEFGPFLKRRLYHPLLMTDTGYCGDADLDTRLASLRYTDPKSTAADGSAIRYSFSWLNRGATSIVTNVWDMYRWSRGVMDDIVLSRKAMEVWTKPVKDDYACGWMRKPGVGGRAKISHGGDTRGFHTMYTIYPEERAVVVILANSAIPREKYALSGKLEKLLLEGAAGKAEEPAAVGRYRAPGDGCFEIAASGAMLLLRPRGQPALDRLVAGAEHEGKPSRELEALNDAAEDLAKALVKRKKRNFREAFAEGAPRSRAEAFCERWDLCGKELGRAKSAEVLGTIDPGTGPLTFFESVHGKGVAYWRIRWEDGKPVDGGYSGRDFPIEVRLCPAGEDAFVARSLVGSHPLRFSLRSRKGKVSALVREKVDGHPAKREEYRRTKK